MKGMKRFLFFAVLILVLMVPAHHARAQTSSAGTTVTPKVFDTTGFPQWAKDLRRWEIVAFGSFPFTMFASTFAMDTRRWIDANGMDFTEDGRRYAPWPFKSAGAIAMTNREVETSLIIAAGLSVAIAFTDLLIVQLKRHKERRRAENMPRGNVIINTSPWPEGSTITDDADAGGAPGGENAPEVPAVP
jgi:hypothetical protein